MEQDVILGILQMIVAQKGRQWVISVLNTFDLTESELILIQAKGFSSHTYYVESTHVRMFNKIEAIKELRMILNLGLADSKAMIEHYFDKHGNRLDLPQPTFSSVEGRRVL